MRTGAVTATAAIILGLFTGACGDGVTGPDGNAVITVPFEFVESAAGVSRFRLLGINGGVTVTGHSQGETFTVSGVRRVQGCTRSEAEARIEDLVVEVTVTAVDIVIQTHQPMNTGSCSLIVDYELSIPDRLSGQIANVNGEISVGDLDNGVSLTNVNGSITLSDVEDDITVRLTNGDISADLRPDSDDDIDLMTVNGSLDVRIPVTTNALLSISLANGMISVANLDVADETSSPTSLSGTLGTGEALVVLSTTNGNVTLTGV